ncbi:MAG TPA: calcineurin-like phosphoesterase C-terminal domain-containing protein, partial [Opitutaceae bacterium]
GAYRLPDRPGLGAFVIKPRGWRPPVDASNLPLFHAQGPVANFALQRDDEPDDLRVLVLTDPQPSSPAEIEYLSRGLVERLGRRTDFDFGVTLGDVVYDRPDLFAGVNRALAAVGIPWYSLPGNHDLTLGDPNEHKAVAAFEAVYGPSTYAFHAGPAVFVALDDVRPQGGPRFIGGLRGDQFQFLQNVLNLAPPEEWVVLMMHIPMFAPYPTGPETFRRADRLRLLAMLKDRRKVLILSGHTHYQRHVMYGPADGWTGAAPLEDYNVAAACGGFWGGPKGPGGIPVSTMWDGTPPGYGIVEFKAGSAELTYVPALLPADYQMAIHAPKAVAPGQGYVSFFANVFNGHDGWRVEARVDERAWGPMTRTVGWDPSYASAYLAQDSLDRPAAGLRLPDPVACYHLWRGTLPADLAPGAHLLHVRATDPHGVAWTSECTFAIERP